MLKRPDVSIHGVPIRSFRWLTAWVISLWLLPGSASADLYWRSVPTHRDGEGLTAVAFDSSSGRVVVGSARGVFVGSERGVFELAVARGEVRDLAFAGDAAPFHALRPLFAATSRGVYRISSDGQEGPRAPDPAEGARDVLRVAVSAGAEAAVALATSAGAFLSRDGEAWERLSSQHPAGPVEAIALRAPPRADVESAAAGPEPLALECWTLSGGGLWRSVVPAAGAADAVRTTRRETIPFASRDDGAIDIATGIPGSEVVVLYADALAVRRRVSQGFESSWKIVRPVLPPGAHITRIASALGRIWLATDRGLLEARSLESPWHRTGAPAGTARVRDLAGDAHKLFVASDSRLFVAVRGEDEGAQAEPFVAPPSDAPRTKIARPGIAIAEPHIRDLHRAAIAYLDLSRGRLDGMRRRVGRRGWLPVVSLQGSHDRDEDWSTDFDQTFTSGALHDLVDSNRDDSRAVDVSLYLTWDLGDVVYHPEEIDVSREIRALLTLRDDVLDELTQLYFDRRRSLEQLSTLPSTSSEARALRLRADELAAGMDSWTGGWFSGQLVGSPP